MDGSFSCDNSRCFAMKNDLENDDLLFNYNKVLAISSDFDLSFQYLQTENKLVVLK